MNTQEILDERGNTHGEFAHNAATGQALKAVARNSESWELRTDIEKEAIEYILSKIARWVSAPGYHDDNPVDIAGYATLVSERLGK